MAQSIQPLRIQKGTPSSSPGKMNAPPTQRPLAELGPMERRRNSPSYNQNTKKSVFENEGSPFESSPFSSASPKSYWKNRDLGSPTRFNAENRNPIEGQEHPTSAGKRSSIENLKRASRVKNSNMFAREHKQEYDPASSPSIERPLASGRPLSASVQSNAHGGHGLEGFWKENGPDIKKSLNQSPLRSPARIRDLFEPNAPQIKAQTSPSKSSMSSKSRYTNVNSFDPESSIWTDEEDSIAERQLPPGKTLHRHAKSVTFDAAPPQVNEYEMTTPDPSSVASGSRDGSHDSEEDDDEDESFDRGSSIDRDDSFDASLEDTEKTPVVLPEDWRFMSPALANEDLASKIEDPFDLEIRSPSPTVKAHSAVDARMTPTRTDSGTSDAERRPLPPLPPPAAKAGSSRERSNSTTNRSAALERAMQTPRKEASPPRPASLSKAELQGMGGLSMPLEERLRLMMVQDHESPKSAVEEQRERRLRRSSPLRETHSQDNESATESIANDVDEEVPDLDDYKMPPRISRDSILRKVKDRAQQAKAGEDGSSGLPSSQYDQSSALNLDPDQPLPTTETEGIDEEMQIKPEDADDSEIDVYSIPELYNSHLQAQSFVNAMQKLEVIEKSQIADEASDVDDGSHYSDESKADDFRDGALSRSSNDEGPPTPRAKVSLNHGMELDRKNSQRMSLPQFAALLGEQDFGLGMESFLTPSPRLEEEPVKQQHHDVKHSWSSLPSSNSREGDNSAIVTGETNFDGFAQRPITPEEQLLPPQFLAQGDYADEEPHTPDSVIRHPVEEFPVSEAPVIPEPVATIKSSGSKLKTRPSATPADIRTMAETRRQVSGEVPNVPQIPSKHLGRPSVVAEGDELESEEDGISHEKSAEDHEALRQPKRKSSLVALEIPVEETGGLGFGIESEFDRVIEAQKKGYLMRQNTKVIVASSASHESAGTESSETAEGAARGTRSAGNSPRKASDTKTWTTEPWNGKIRRKSIRQSGGIPSKRAPSGPVPPLPGQESNVAGTLDSVNETEGIQNTDEIAEDGERGRLFVKVVRVKDLDLPLPKGERSYFALTLDNGLHCVTTSWLELGRTAPIGQEFELIVLNDLEFQLTLQTKLEEPKAKAVPESPTKTPKMSKPSAFSKVFSSPRKRKELELKQQEEAQRADKQRQQEAQASRRAAQPTAWDLLHKLVAKDGSFARSYVCLKDHEKQAYGQPLTVDVPCFNEWATEESTGCSYKSKRAGSDFGIQRRAPYRIGKLELQLFYVPKPKDAKDDDMPKSMNACIRELKEAESATPKQWEGHLSQQGGDCPFWRRRFFTLEGLKLTAYHEATRQPRATINLAKASKLIDDKSALMRTDASPKKGGRRKSAFAEEEEGYMFVEEGFRIRFANGEIIDFYADSAAEKDGWMAALAEVVGKDQNKTKTWTDLVLARRRAASDRTKRTELSQAKTHSTKQAPPAAKSAPPTPAKTFMPKPAPVPQKSPRRSDVAQKRADPSKTRSLVF